jgi:pimeloyl-ACP methyl ester carboxylesterase
MMKHRDRIAIGVFVVFYVGFGVLLTVFQERLVYQPFAQDFDACPLLTDAEKITYNGTRMYVQEGEKGVVVLYHGNAGSACDRAFYADIIEAEGYGYVLVEYAGYSNDPRQTTHELVKQDVQHVVAYLGTLDAARIVVVGESIGSGPASYHTSLLAPDALVLITPFTTLPDIAKNRFWFYPTRLLADNPFDNGALLQEYKGPVTIIHGENDSIVPQKLGRTLYENLSTTQKEFVSVPNEGHNSMYDSSLLWSAFRDVLASTAGQMQP